MEQVLKLDKDCEEAAIDLFNCKVLQLMVNTVENKAAKLLPVSSVPVSENNQSFLWTLPFLESTVRLDLKWLCRKIQ